MTTTLPDMVFVVSKLSNTFIIHQPFLPGSTLFDYGTLYALGFYYLFTTNMQDYQTAHHL